MTILLADAGSTKTDWVRLTKNQHSAKVDGTYSGPGISPVHNDSESICNELLKVSDNLGVNFDKIRFYGSGVGSPLRIQKVEECLEKVFSCSDIKADSDMSAAAHAVLGNNPGVACIMGTGSNSCHYDGISIDRKSASLGFILDDDGGGVAFGKRLITDIFKGIAPEDIRNKFFKRYNLQIADVIEHIYRQPSPNRWIAGFMPFITDNIDNPYIIQLVNSQIERFIEREFANYSEFELKNEGVGFVGSIAVIFADKIKYEFGKRNWKIRDFTAKPMSKLIEYELNALVRL